MANKCARRLCLVTNCLWPLLLFFFSFFLSDLFPFVSLLSLAGFIFLNQRFFFISPISKTIYFGFLSFPTMTNIVFFWFSGVVKINELGWKNKRFSLTNCSIMWSYRFVSISKENCQTPRRACLLTLEQFLAWIRPLPGGFLPEGSQAYFWELEGQDMSPWDGLHALTHFSPILEGDLIPRKLLGND